MLKWNSVLFALLAALLIMFGCASSSKAPEKASEKPNSQVALQATQQNAQMKSESKTEPNFSGITCEQNADLRKLEVKTKDKGCELEYTKFGTTSVVASSSVSKSHCENTLDKIKSKLVTSGFRCS